MTETAVHRAPVVLEVNGVRHPLSPPGVVLGRGSEAELRINDPGVSRRHAQIKVTVTSQDVSVSVLDLGSTNGTVVDGQRVNGESPLRDGSQILLGNTTLTVRNPHAARSGGL
jgi:pSer/pThr/pTyr-binding forkhead associated (FHA) protein